MQLSYCQIQWTGTISSMCLSHLLKLKNNCQGLATGYFSLCGKVTGSTAECPPSHQSKLPRIVDGPSIAAQPLRQIGDLEAQSW
jgi:hypothetical protein